jgi:hypothetical protein
VAIALKFPIAETLVAIIASLEDKFPFLSTALIK